MTKNRIVVVGVSAAGKTTFARALSKKTRLPLVYMDALVWKPGWEYATEDANVDAIREFSAAERWIIEGYVEQATHADLFTKADTVIYLDYSRWVGTWRYVKRCWNQCRKPRVELPDTPDVFSFHAMKMIWRKHEMQTLEELLRAEEAISQKTVRLQKPSEAERFLESV